MIGVHFKFSHCRATCGRWGHRPRQAAPVGVPTNRRKFEIRPFVFLLIHSNPVYLLFVISRIGVPIQPPGIWMCNKAAMVGAISVMLMVLFEYPDLIFHPIKMSGICVS